MLNFLKKLFDTNEKEIKRLRLIIEKINRIKPTKNFKQKTEELKKRLAQGEKLDSLLPEAFNNAREAAEKAIGLRPFDEQLMAAICFHEGKIAEQKTGEGKTLSAVPALYLNALTGKNCHLVTVNDYLAKRDAGWNGPIFNLLGISVGVIVHEQAYIFDPNFTNENTNDQKLKHLRPISRQEAYQANITYGTNNEFGFDYLRDNMVQSLEEIVQREHYFAIVDEVDSILIDEARTPLIISAPDTEPTQKYYQFAALVGQLMKGVDFESDEKHKTVNLTEHGIKKIEKKLGIENLYEKDFDTIHHLEQALKAREHFHRDKDYVVKDDEVIIVDEFTGRLMFGRRFSEGLHQAIEAKENVTIKQESKTMATISFQNYFRMYEKLAGMTGTAATEAEEFKKIYNLETVVLPTHKPMIRQDFGDVVYKTVRAKYAAIVKEIEERHKTGQPILIGTTSIEKNQIIDEFLKRKKIPHQVLNAKNHEKEAQIISQAGKIGAVTVATNMAGRGVDIVLGDNKKEHEKLLKLGGLHVIGVERHESRRIDNQLRGRSGRQGDPGSSRFYVSLEDDIMRIFGGEQIAKLMTTLNMPEDVPLEHVMVSKAIEQAQIKVESFHFDSRKNLVEYDDVLNKQREIIYQKRRLILKEQNLKDKIKEILDKETQALIERSLNPLTKMPEPDNLITELIGLIPFDPGSQKRILAELKKAKEPKSIITIIEDIVTNTYNQREQQIGEELMRQVEKLVMLNTIDNLWIEHLDAIDDLREGIGLRGYGQRNPLVEYKAEAFTMFERLIKTIDFEISRRIFRVQINEQVQPRQKPETKEVKPKIPQPELKTDQALTGVSDFANAFAKAGINRPPTITNKPRQKIGRNDPCWCGSGKKFKKCHYPQQAN